MTHLIVYFILAVDSYFGIWSWATLFCAIVVEVGSLQSSNMARQHPHELVPQISWQLTIWYHSTYFTVILKAKPSWQSGNPLHSDQQLKQALCLREQYLYLYMYECISLCILNLYKPYHLYTDFVI